MTRTKESIGVAIPTYQRPELLRLLLSTIPADVLVSVSDNGSLLPEAFKQAHPGVRFAGTGYVLPMFTNWNHAARAQTADWISITSDDDLYRPGAFDVVRTTIDEYPTADMLIFGHDLIDGQGRTFSTWKPPLRDFVAPAGFSLFKYGVSARMPSIFFRRTLFERLGGFMTSLKLTAADSDLVQRAALVGNVTCVPRVISGYRVWEGGLTSSRIATSEWMDEIDQWCRNVRDFDAEVGSKLYTRHLRDEIYLQNLLAGVGVLRSRAGRSASVKHLFRQGIPLRARPASYVRLLLALLRPVSDVGSSAS